MTVSNWITSSTIVQGDVSYTLRKSNLTDSYIDIQVFSFSEKWNAFDVALEYRLNSIEEWKTDAVIISTTAKYLNGNKLYGLTLSKTGIEHLIRWKYIDNNLYFGQSPEIRLRILPRIRTFSNATSTNFITSVYGEKYTDLEHSTTNKCIAIGIEGQFICANSNSIFTFTDLTEAVNSSYSNVSNVSYAKQINNGGYIVCDYGNDKVLELNSTLTSVIKTYNSGGKPSYVDYSEENESLLVTLEDLNRVDEITWSTADNGTLLWQSNISMSTPQSATYNRDNENFVLISDTGNNRIILINKVDDTNQIYQQYLYNSQSLGTEISPFFGPIRSFFDSDKRIIVIEQSGRPLDFDIVESSSSSEEFSSSSSSS